MEEEKTPTEVAQNLGIPVGLLYKWIQKHKGVDAKGKTNDFQKEIQPLKNKDQELKK